MEDYPGNNGSRNTNKIDDDLSNLMSNLLKSDKSDYSSMDSYSEDDDQEFGAGYAGYQKNQMTILCRNTNLVSKNSGIYLTTYQLGVKLFEKYTNRINLEKYDPREKLSDQATNKFIDNVMIYEKYVQATSEQIIDVRTRMILYKLFNRGIIDEINGCISTGNEGNIYHATTKTHREYAIKIYKYDYSLPNTRKMARKTAEKEWRNLVLLRNKGIFVPEPIILRGHVLLMEFCSQNGWPAPRLKDFDISSIIARKLYRDCVIIMWKIYNQCNLVHGDLSEFNMLVLNDQLIIIGVSQSVKNDNSLAFELLYKDCVNVTEYFQKKDVVTMNTKELFGFITDPSITIYNVEDYLNKIVGIIQEPSVDCLIQQEKTEEEVFKNNNIPKRLVEVMDYELNTSKDHKEDGEPLVYKKMFELKSDLAIQVKPKVLFKKKTNSVTVGSDYESNDDENNDNNNTYAKRLSKFRNFSRLHDESPESKKARKESVKDDESDESQTKVKENNKKKTWKIGFHKK